MTLLDAAQQGLVERDDALTSAFDALTAAGFGSGGSVLIQGPPGIGKTSLLQVIAAHARSTGFQVLEARCAVLEEEFPFGVVRQLLERHIRAMPDAQRRQAFKGGVAARAAGVLGIASPEKEARDEAHSTTGVSATLHALFWLCANLAERAPLLLTVDDGQWADLLSLQFVLYAARRAEGLPMSFIVASRQHVADDSRRKLLAQLSAEPSHVVVELQPLSRAGTAELVRRRSSVNATEEVCDRCFQLSGGNPFLASELAANLGEDADSPASDALQTVRGVRGEAVTAQLVLRLARLPDVCREICRALIVLEEDPEPALLAELAEVRDTQVAAAADMLVAEGILQPGVLAFRHPIIADALAADAGAVRLEGAHRRAAELLHRRRAPAERIAAHLLHARGPVGGDWPVDALVVAAEGARASGSLAAAAQLLRRALDEQPPPQRRADVLLRMGETERSLGAPGAIDHLRESLALTVDAAARARVALELAAELDRRGQFGEAGAVCMEGLASIGDMDRELMLLLRGVLLSTNWGKYEGELRVLADRVLAETADLSGATPGERLLLAQAAITQLLSGGDVARAVDLARRALGTGALLHDGGAATVPWRYAVGSLLFAGEFLEALRHLEMGQQHARETGDEVLMIYSLTDPHCHYEMATDLRNAEADVRLAYDIAQRHERMSMPRVMALAAMASVLRQRGRASEAWMLLEEEGWSGEIGDDVLGQVLLMQRSFVRLEMGDLVGGVQDLLNHGRFCTALRGHLPLLCPWRTYAAPALARAGKADEARALIEEELREAFRSRERFTIGRALHAAALVRGGDDAVSMFEEAVGWLDRPGSDLARAYALLDLGSALRRSNHRSAAREPLAHALDIADRIGADGIAHRAREELVVLGARPRRARLTGLQALSPSEIRVARLAAAGDTNRDIAQALFITVKTVEKHLAAAYGKLGIDSRQQLAHHLADVAAVGAAR